MWLAGYNDMIIDRCMWNEQELSAERLAEDDSDLCSGAQDPDPYLCRKRNSLAPFNRS